MHLRTKSDIRSIALERLELPTPDQLRWLERSFKLVAWGLPVQSGEIILVKSNEIDFAPILRELNLKEQGLCSLDDTLSILRSKPIEYKALTGYHKYYVFITESSVLSFVSGNFPFQNLMEYPIGQGWYSLWRSSETETWRFCVMESWMMIQSFVHKHNGLIPIIKSLVPSTIDASKRGYQLPHIGEGVDFDSVLQHFEGDVFGLGEYPFEFDSVFVELKYHHSDVTKPMKVEFKFGMKPEVWKWDLNGEFGDILLLEYNEQRDCLTRFNFGEPHRIDIVNPEGFWIYGAENQERFDNEDYFWAHTLGDCLTYARLLVREQRLNMRRYCEGPKSEK